MSDRSPSNKSPKMLYESRTLKVVIYVLIVFATLIVVGSQKETYFSAIARPIFGNYSSYEYFLWGWVILTLASWVPIVGAYCFILVNAPLLSNAYFVLILHSYFAALTAHDIFYYASTAAAVNILAVIRDFADFDIVLFNIAVASAVAPLALQYAIVAQYSQ